MRIDDPTNEQPEGQTTEPTTTPAEPAEGSETNADASASNDERSVFDAASKPPETSGEGEEDAEGNAQVEQLAEPAKFEFPKVTKAQMRDLSGALEINIRERVGKAWSKLSPADRKRVADVSARAIKIAIDGRKIKDTEAGKLEKQRREVAQLYAQLANIRVIAATITKAAFDKLVGDVLTRLTNFAFAVVA
jgi:hypothetical protein